MQVPGLGSGNLGDNVHQYHPPLDRSRHYDQQELDASKPVPPQTLYNVSVGGNIVPPLPPKSPSSSPGSLYSRPPSYEHGHISPPPNPQLSNTIASGASTITVAPNFSQLSLASSTPTSSSSSMSHGQGPSDQYYWSAHNSGSPPEQYGHLQPHYQPTPPSRFQSQYGHQIFQPSNSYQTLSGLQPQHQLPYNQPPGFPNIPYYFSSPNHSYFNYGHDHSKDNDYKMKLEAATYKTAKVLKKCGELSLFAIKVAGGVIALAAGAQPDFSVPNFKRSSYKSHTNRLQKDGIEVCVLPGVDQKNLQAVLSGSPNADYGAVIRALLTLQQQQHLQQQLQLQLIQQQQAAGVVPSSLPATTLDYQALINELIKAQNDAISQAAALAAGGGHVLPRSGVLGQPQLFSATAIQPHQVGVGMGTYAQPGLQGQQYGISQGYQQQRMGTVPTIGSNIQSSFWMHGQPQAGPPQQQTQPLQQQSGPAQVGTSDQRLPFTHSTTTLNTVEYNRPTSMSIPQTPLSSSSLRRTSISPSESLISQHSPNQPGTWQPMMPVIPQALTEAHSTTSQLREFPVSLSVSVAGPSASTHDIASPFS